MYDDTLKTATFYPINPVDMFPTTTLSYKTSIVSHRPVLTLVIKKHLNMIERNSSLDILVWQSHQYAFN